MSFTAPIVTIFFFGKNSALIKQAFENLSSCLAASHFKESELKWQVSKRLIAYKGYMFASQWVDKVRKNVLPRLINPQQMDGNSRVQDCNKQQYPFTTESREAIIIQYALLMTKR